MSLVEGLESRQLFFDQIVFHDRIQELLRAAENIGHLVKSFLLGCRQQPLIRRTRLVERRCTAIYAHGCSHLPPKLLVLIILELILPSNVYPLLRRFQRRHYLAISLLRI